ncbi:hypothetical protein Rhopal_003395-T1 [Rhodotorula paludigena]|uniref:Spc7 kinetochore protein domain-containing protein n=1 Tax=Rhodotorula paludigena TaxID=86838 RepID=A0AAV5GIZ9_9BASI|nr:hypothetical protein Rhopal_003395-T1 [Rhodotorula paludigena]
MGATPSGEPLLPHRPTSLVAGTANPAEAAPASAKRKKRAQSLGGEALEDARKRLRGLEGVKQQDGFLGLELSPGKVERRQARPRRSILKQTPAVFAGADNHTIHFPPTSDRARVAAWDEAHSHTTDLSALSVFSTAAAPAPAVAAAAKKAARRSSIKPPRASVGGASTTYDDSDGGRSSDMASSDEDDEDPDGSLDMDVTKGDMTALYDLEGRRKSLAPSRRVSFAPNAAIRTFTPDKPTAEAQSFAAEAARRAAEAAEAASATGDISVSSSQFSLSSEDEHDDEDDDAALESEPSMEIAGDEVTLAFAGHFAGTQIPVSVVQHHEGDAGSASEEDNDDRQEASEDGTMAMDEVTDSAGITSAFAAHFSSSTTAATAERAHEGGFDASAVHARATAEQAQFTLFGASSSASGPAAKRTPRFSEVARAEDEDDEAVMRELGFARGGRPRKSRLPSLGREALAEVEEDEDDDDEEMEDATGAMDMTTAVGGIVQPEDEDDEDEMDSDAEVSMQLTSGDRTADVTFATTASARDQEDDIEDEDDGDKMEDATATMLEATTYGSILPPTSSTAAPLSLLAAAPATSIFARASSAPPPQSPAARAAEYKTPSASATERQSSPSLARPGLTRALSVPATLEPRSPFRAGSARPQRHSTASPGPPNAQRSPFRSPRRVPLDSPRAGSTEPHPLPAAARARRSASPVKSAYAPPSSLAAAPPPKSPRRSPALPLAAVREEPAAAPAEAEQVPGVTARSRSRSRSRSLSPVKQQPAAPQQQAVPNTPGRAVFQPRALAPPQSAGRSPGGSLSLRALMSGKVGDEKENVGANGGATAGLKDKRVKDLAMEGEEMELNLTGSSFDASFEEGRDAPALPASLDAFFGATGTSFVNDVVALVDVEKSAANRRKSMAALGNATLTDDQKPAGPPTFADLTVAGACKSLLHKLYTEESRRLAESLEEVQTLYDEQEAAIRDGGLVPRVFQDWSNATEEAKAIMKGQFGQIKLHYLLRTQLEWKQVRSHNYGQIIGVMEQNLDDLRAVEVASVIPALEDRHAALRAELEAERKLDVELSAMSPEDVEYLQGLLADSEEQEEQLNGNPEKGIPGRRPELDRIEQHLRSYHETFDKYSAEEARLQAEIADLEELRRDKRTRADLVRLKADFEALQHVQGWHLVHFAQDRVVMRHFDEFVVDLALRPGSLAVERASFQLALPKKAAASLGGQITAFLLDKIGEEVDNILSQDTARDARSILRYVASRACVLRHIRHEVALTSLRYPVTATVSPSSLDLHIDVYCASSRRGFDVVVPLSSDQVIEPKSVEGWAEHLSASVIPRFGAGIDALALAQTVNDRLDSEFGRNALVEAVLGAEEECDNL